MNQPKTSKREATPLIVTLNKGGTAEKQIALNLVVIPDLWHVRVESMEQKQQVLDCWHLAADLKRELLKRYIEHQALNAVAEAAFNAKEGAYSQEQHDALCEALSALATLRAKEGR